MAKKTVTSMEKGTKKLPYHTPVLYKFLTNDDGKSDTSVAQRDRVQERLRDHLPGGKDYLSGAKVRVEPVRSIGKAEANQSWAIARTKPPRNKRGE